MSLYAVVDEQDCGQVATTKGWSDFFDWADAQGYRQLAHLVYHGFTQKLLALANEIDAAIAKSNPPPSVETTARGIEAICRENPDAGILIVTDGVTGSDDEEYDDDDEYDEDDEEE